jgi:ATP-dependent Lhr-like helicase
VRNWFEAAFEAPTPAQAGAWPAIATGENVLICAPTGSGKTLAAFLWALDRIVADRAAGPADAPHYTRLIYVSPMKALSYDVERNLRVPLRGLGTPLRAGGSRGAGADVRVGTRTGDTPARERAAMLRKPPDILITTPESLYLMLTSRASEILQTAETVILDEIHAVAATKRGAHLALSLERLQALCPRELQRIGLSATQNPLEEVARFMVGPGRRARIVDAGAIRSLDLRIHVPVESMVEPDQGLTPSNGHDARDGLAGGEATRRSIWPAIYPELLEQVRAHRSTIIFVNSRRSAERLALRLNDLAAEPNAGSPADDPAADPKLLQKIARAHHGSLSREERTSIEELLKAGELPCLVATSSLELGIDMGAVDLVIQVESPKSVARGLQRIGRAGP